jgi:hypothetical protein
MSSPEQPSRPTELMDFRQFLVWSEDVRRVHPRVDRCCETRIDRAFSHLQPIPEKAAVIPTIHRCDLVRLWGKVRGVASSPRTTLATEGVRHSLQVIFQLLAEDPELCSSENSPTGWQQPSLPRASKRGPLASCPVGAMSTKPCWMWRGRKVREGAS